MMYGAPAGMWGGSVDVSSCAAGILLGGLLTYNSKQWLPALQKRLNKEKTA